MPKFGIFEIHPDKKNQDVKEDDVKNENTLNSAEKKPELSLADQLMQDAIEGKEPSTALEIKVEPSTTSMTQPGRSKL